MAKIGQYQNFAMFNLFCKSANLPLEALFLQQAVCLEVLCNCEGIIDLESNSVHQRPIGPAIYRKIRGLYTSLPKNVIRCKHGLKVFPAEQV